MAHDWLLLETIGTEPTVVASGNQPRNMVPLSSFLRRSRNLRLIHRAVNAATSANRCATVALSDPNLVIDVRPLAMPDGRVHGCWLWAGATAAVTPPPAAAGAALLDPETAVLHLSDGAALAIGMSPDEPHTELVLAQMYQYADPPSDETEVLRLMVTATEGMTYSATWPGTDYLGNPTRCHFAARLVIEPDSNGAARRLSRAVNLRVGNAEPVEPILEQRLLEATREPGCPRALVMISSRKLIKWIDPPLPEWHWEYDPLERPKVHPDDADALGRMIDDSALGISEAAIRFRRHDGGWTVLHCTAQMVSVGDDAPYALVTLRPSDRP